jgi:predicted dehydrogenase
MKAETPMVGSKLRVGIAGLGFGGGVHLPVLRARSDVEIVALLARDRAKAEAAAKTFEVGAACTSLAAFLDREIDAVVIALPPEPAGHVAKAALARDLAVLAEKPIAATAAAADALAADARDLTTMVDFEFRELPSFLALKALLEAKRLGRIRTVRISWRSLSWAQKARAWSWKTDAAQGGGVLTLSGLHLFDLLEWLLGPVTVEGARRSYAATRAFAPTGARPAADTVELSLAADGVPVAVHLSNAARDRHGHRWEIDAEGGRLTLDDGGIGTFGGFTLTLGSDTLAADPKRDGDYRLGPVAAIAERFVAAARARQPVAPGFGEGARAQRLLERANALPERAPA